MVNNLIWGCVIVGCGAYSLYCLVQFGVYVVEHIRKQKEREE